MFHYLRNRWFLWAALLVFVIAAVPHLYYPFYWDESYVYAPAIYKMYDHGPSLFPQAVPVKYSTGHPLFFYAACAAWMKVFGASVFSMHCFALTVSCLLVVAMYEILFNLFGKPAATIGAALLVFSLHFLASATIVVSDIMLGLLALAGLYFYARDKYLAAGSFFVMLFFTKEAAWVVAILLFADIAYRAVTRKDSLKQIFFKTMSVLVPVCLVAIFFVLQKKAFGWYLYPQHTRSFDLSIGNTLNNLQRSIGVFLHEDQAYYYLIPMLPLAVYATVKQRNLRYLFPALLLVWAFLQPVWFSYKDAVSYVFAAVLLTAASVFFTIRVGNNALQERFLKLTGAFFLLFLYFCCVNFYESRYVFPSLVVLLLLLAMYMDRLIAASALPALRVVLPAYIFAAGVVNYCLYWRQLVAYQQMDAQLDVVNYFEKNGFYDKYIACSFLEHEHLTDARTGFLRGGRVFGHVSEEIGDTTTAVVIDNIDTDASFGRIRADSAFHLVHRYQNGEIWVEVYERRR